MLKFILKLIINKKLSFIYLFNYKHFKENEDFDIYENLNYKDYLYHSFDDYKLLILKFENIKNFKNIFNNLGYEYNNSHSNESINEVSNIIKKNPKLIGLTNEIVDEIYNNEIIKKIYSQEEITKFKKKYIAN